MNTKTLARFEIKDEAKGQVTAVFSTFNVIDSDRDVTPPGAFEDGADVVISSYGHTSWEGALPVGKGVIRTTKSEALLDGQFFMDTAAGADTFRVVKALGPLGQWSYGYDAIKYSFGEFDDQRVRFLEQLKVHEVSPVLLGAGVGTRTLAAKALAGLTGGGLKFTEEAAAVLAAVTALTDRAADVMAKRADRGKQLGTDSRQLLTQVEAELKRLGDLLTTARDEQDDDQDGAEQWHAQLEREFLLYAARIH
jgi:HK97 family phage prohead protease